jgi:hypothetical protein
LTLAKSASVQPISTLDMVDSMKKAKRSEAVKFLEKSVSYRAQKQKSQGESGAGSTYPSSSNSNKSLTGRVADVGKTGKQDSNVGVGMERKMSSGRGPMSPASQMNIETMLENAILLLKSGKTQ